MPDLAKRLFALLNPVRAMWEQHEGHFFSAKVKKIAGTTDATAGTQTAHAHGLPITPAKNMILITSEGAGTVYPSADPDATNIFVKGEAASLPFVAWIIYEL